MTRSLAPRRIVKRQPKRPAPDPTATYVNLCDRCGREIWATGRIPIECVSCVNQAIKEFGLGPVEGGMGGE